MDNPDRVTAYDIRDRIQQRITEIQSEKWTDEQGKRQFISGMRTTVLIIDRFYLQEE